jgi:hypothetical protein
LSLTDLWPDAAVGSVSALTLSAANLPPLPRRTGASL